MRKTLAAAVALAALSALAPLAIAQSRGDYGRDRDRGPPRAEQYYPNRTATQAELNATDARLNRVYQRRIADAMDADRGDRYGRPRGWYSQEASLRAAERTWIAYRDADCRFAVQPALGTHGLYDATMRACLIERTNERIATLQGERGTQVTMR